MVAMNVWPTDAADGSVANEARWRKMARHWQGTGVCAGVGLEMAPTLAGTNLTIRNGAAWVDGHFCELLGDQVLTVTANGIAVVRFDPAANTAELIYRDGITIPAQSPTGVFEMVVAQITGSALVDKRVLVSTAPTPWVVATFTNGWVGTATPLSYRKVDDIVYLRGGARSGASTVFVLPVGFRPAKDEVVVILLQGGLLGYANINASNGTVVFNGANNNDCQISVQFSITP